MVVKANERSRPLADMAGQPCMTQPGAVKCIIQDRVVMNIAIAIWSIQHALLLQDAVEHTLIVVILPGSPGVHTFADEAQDQLKALQQQRAPVNGRDCICKAFSLLPSHQALCKHALQ